MSHAAAFAVQVSILNRLMSSHLVYLTHAHFRNPLVPNRHLQKRFHLSTTTSSSSVGHKNLLGPSAAAKFTVKSSAASLVLFRLSKTIAVAGIFMNGLILFEEVLDWLGLGFQDSFGVFKSF